MYIFKSRYPKADPNVLYITENHAVNLLLNDSVRVAILSRDLDTAEINVIKRLLIFIFHSSHDHPGYPKENDILPGNQH